MKAAVFFDIDNTLLAGYSFIPESTIQGIRELRANGHYAFICTGRSRAFVRNPQIIDIGFDGVVAGCGTHVEFQDKMVYEFLMPQEQVADCMRIIREVGFRPILEGPDALYFDYPDFDENDGFGNRLRADKSLKLEEIHDHVGPWRVNKISCATEVDEDKYRQGMEGLGQYFDACIHNPTVVEYVPKNHSKATGIEEVCKYLGIPRENTYAFGDSVNDLEMLKYAGTGICMGNGTEEAKAASDYVTAELMDDGIYKGLKHFGLI
ncbi:MAG: Cof-type HAD-IIB family hydrolase [Lachnospiraceae bacterium]|nr:Cof-type HAD-IIB family hydrolase [Candidatus Equihabitans merdae]